MNVLVDSCFWFAYLGSRHKDQYGESAKQIYDICFEKRQYNIIIPFPSLYETVNTTLLRDKNKDAADWFLKKLVSDRKYQKVFDDMYRDVALIETSKNTRKISLVDNIIRLMFCQHQMMNICPIHLMIRYRSIRITHNLLLHRPNLSL